MNDITTTGHGPFNPSLKMSSLEIAELMEKNHRDVMRDIRDLIDQDAIDQRRFAPISYVDSMNRNQPAYELDFQATMVLITGYDVKRRAKVIDRWMKLETGEAIPAMATASAIDAMTAQIIQMVVPSVINQATAAIMGQITPMLQGLRQKVNNVQINFSEVGTIWSFSYHCCQEGGANTYVTKEELYRAYCEYCSTFPYCRPDGKSTFFTRIYRSFHNSSSSTINRFGQRVPVVRGMAMLPGYDRIIDDLRRKRQEDDAAELARRRAEYCGVVETPEAN